MLVHQAVPISGCGAETLQPCLRISPNVLLGAIRQTMIDFGFLPYSRDPFPRVLRQLPGRSTQTGNTHYLSDIDYVQDRLKMAPEIVLPWR